MMIKFSRKLGENFVILVGASVLIQKTFRSDLKGTGIWAGLEPARTRACELAVVFGREISRPYGCVSDTHS